MDVNLTGQSLGSYRIIEQIGKGGMATVFKAYEPALDRYVAIKILPEYFAHYPEFVTRFEREAKAIARLDHPNIVPIYGYGQDKGFMYLVMRYVQAGTLREMLGHPLPLPMAVDILRQISGALHYAHQLGIIHRDVKPSNVLMADQKWALLTDFGLAKMVESSEQLTRSGVGVGTPAYMSPEQGQGEKVDARSDIYSLGVMLYEMVTGRVPYDAETPMAILLKHISAPLPLPRSVNPDIPESVERVILKAMAKSPDDRFQTAEEMMKALDQALANATTEAPSTLLGVPVQSEAQNLEQPTLAVEQQTIAQVPSPDTVLRPKVTIPEKKESFPYWIWVVAGILLLCLVGGALGFAAFRNRPFIRRLLSMAARVTETQRPTLTPIPTKTFPPPPAPTEAAPPVGQAPQPAFVACLVTDFGGINDKSFNESAWRGVERAKKTFGIETRFLESRQDQDRPNNIRQFLQEGKCGIIFTAGFAFDVATREAAEKWPDQKFAITDFVYQPVIPNVRGSAYRSDQAAFLAGYLAAGMTKTGKVGTYGGLDIPPVTSFMDGFALGVQKYNEVHNAQVKTLGWDPVSRKGIFTGNFTIQEDGWKITEAMVNQGADIIFPAAGTVGVGTLDYLKERQAGFFIGVDSDWAQLFPAQASSILASVMKNVDQFVYETIQLTLEGFFRGDNYMGTLDNGGVGLAINPLLDQRIPQDLRVELGEITLKVISGEIRTQP